MRFQKFKKFKKFGTATTKFKNVPIVIDGFRFDSKLEGRYYQQLKIRQKANDIKYFLRQVSIHLTGNIRYVVDFVIFENDNSVRYIDCKGFETPVFLLKKKLVEAEYPIHIEVVK